MTVKLGLTYGSRTMWFANDPWFVPEGGLRVEYGEEELRFSITLAAKGSLSALSSALRSLRSVVRAIDRSEGELLIDDGIEISAYPIREAQLQELPQRLELWPSGHARVVLVLRCGTEAVSSTARTLLEQFMTETGEPVVVDPEGPAILGLRVRPHEQPLPAAIETYAMDGEYTVSDLIVPLGIPQYDDGTYSYTGVYTPPATELDVYAEVAGPPPMPLLAITSAQAVPPYRRLVALTEPPAVLVGDWQPDDIFIVVSKQRHQAGWVHGGGDIHAQQLSSARAGMPIPPSRIALAIRGAILLGVIYQRSLVREYEWPTDNRLRHSMTITLPALPSGYAYVVYSTSTGSWGVVNTDGWIRPWGTANPSVSGLVRTGYRIYWAFINLSEMTGSSATVTFSWEAFLKATDKTDTFAYIDKSISADLAVCAVPSALFSSIPTGDYRIAVVGYRDSTPVTTVHYEQFIRVPGGYRLRVHFDSRDPTLTHKVFIQRVGATQWYSTSASPPSVTISTPGTAESLPAVAGSGIRETITVTTRPAGVEYPVQERSTAYITGGRKLVPVGRFGFHSGEQYVVQVTSLHPVYRLWALPRPRVAVAGAYVVASRLLETVREQGHHIVRVASGVEPRAEAQITNAYSRPWFMLSSATYPGAARYVLATMADGSGFIMPHTSASPLIVTHPVLNIPLIAIQATTSRRPLAYYHEDSSLTSGRTIGAAIYLYNASTTNRTVTVYLEDDRTSSWQEQSNTIIVPAGSYVSQYLELTLNAGVPSVVAAITASSTTIVYANVIWVEGGWVTGVFRQSFYEIDWKPIETFPYAGPRFFGWNIRQKYVSSSYPSQSHWDRTFGVTFTGTEANDSFSYTVASNRFLVRGGQSYDWERSVSVPAGYSATVSINYPGGSVSGGNRFTPASDGACTFRLSVTKNTSSGGTVSGSYQNLRQVSDTNRLGNLWGAGANVLRIGWPESASSWLIATRIVYRHDVVDGRFMRIMLESGDPLDLEFSGANIVAKRGPSTLLTLTRPSMSPTTLRVSYVSGTLTLAVGEPSSWSSVSTSVSLPGVQETVELNGSHTRGEWGVRWLGLVAGPSSAMLAGTHSLLGSDDGAYAAFLNESSYAYWWAEEPYYVYRPGNIVLGAQRGVLEVSGKCTLVVFPISSIETRDILDRAFVLDVLGYEKR